ncbi:beta-glucosidase [Acidobacteria bacterium Mor1]|nr:beta-glucosidase [Acidobacteria bacterium Mor1]
MSAATPSDVEARVADLIEKMTLAEKIGQMTQINGAGGTLPDDMRARVRNGGLGSVLNEVDVEIVNEIQRIAVEESRLGIPLLFGRDVIHGFRTVLPIPLGQAASFNPELVRRGARMAALEASASGVNWTFAPMIDMSRDPRWGRVAETFGEDPFLTSRMAVAMVRGFQGEDLSAPGNIAACAKHFAGYGAVEAGRDYATTNIAEHDLREVHFPPFRAAVDAGVATLMTSFSDLNGVPATGNRFLMTDVLRGEWNFDGFVVSDWASIEQLVIHGVAEDARDAARQAVDAGVNMEMATPLYRDHLAGLIEQGAVDPAQLDAMVADILRVKFRLGLFERPYRNPSDFPATANDEHLELAREAALQSLVLLQNRDRALPLNRTELRRVAVIGPLADDEYEQLGTWIFDGDTSITRTPLSALRRQLGDSAEVEYVRAMKNSRSRSTEGFAAARDAAASADAVLLFLGEESMLSGEAHCRAEIGLPGNQHDLVRTVAGAAKDKPVIAVIQAGRPLTLAPVLDQVDALLFAWHPGTMGGPAIADVLFGAESPSGKLPMTFPKMVGQIPIFFGHKHTGKPPSAENFIHIDDLEERMVQYSTGLVASHLDAGFEPQFPFGYGLSYASFRYGDIAVSRTSMALGESLTVSATVENTGDVAADEIVQLYTRDLVGQMTRPVRELKGFRRVRLKPGQKTRVTFDLHSDDLAFVGRTMERITEPGVFHAWIGGSSDADLRVEFRVTAAKPEEGS